MISTKQLWDKTWEGAVPAELHDPMYARVLACYHEPLRRYHDIKHVAGGLEYLNRVAYDFAGNPIAVGAAYWFHDIIYDFGADDNEEQSAAFADKCLEEMKFGEPFRLYVHDLILATKHDKPAEKHDQQLICDIDLLTLATDQETFDQFERDIRAEYSHVPEEEYRRGRAALLQKLLDRPSVYQTELLSGFEDKARKNLENLIAKLRQDPDTI